MTTRVHYYGLLAERRGLAEESVSHSCRTAAELYALLDSQHALGLAVKNFRAAVNDAFVDWGHPLAENDSLALLPPMSGG